MELVGRFELLKTRFNNGIAFAAFANQPISPEDALNMLLTVVVKTGVFLIQYEEWHSLPETEKTMANAFIWWATKTSMTSLSTKSNGTTLKHRA